ncbi:arginase-1 isoform X2 [Cryptotermes secundus]|nr:arginase-1 isoform X2 [Cryptotermes secundus]
MLKFSSLRIFSRFTRYRLLINLRRSHSRIGVLGVPFDKGQLKGGVGSGPEAFRKLGLIEELQHLGCDVKDFGDVVYEQIDGLMVENMTALGHIAACQKEVSDSVIHILNEGRMCLTIGGDHSCGIGTIDGHVKVKGNIALLWVDAHADLNTNATSSTGNIHGMPVALLAKELSDYWPYLPGMDWQQPRLSIRNIAYIGLRDIDSYERLVIDKFSITAFGMEDVERYGIIEVTNMALRRIDPNNNLPLHVSFDIDSLDALEAPSTGTPVRGGLTLREGIQIMEESYRTQRLSAVDLVEVNPRLGSPSDVRITLEAAKHIIRAASGYSRRGHSPENVCDLPQQTFPSVSTSAHNRAHLPLAAPKLWEIELIYIQELRKHEIIDTLDFQIEEITKTWKHIRG